MNNAEHYVKSIKSPRKRMYASRYLNWLRFGKKGYEPSNKDYVPALSYMAAQAVRIRLISLIQTDAAVLGQKPGCPTCAPCKDSWSSAANRDQETSAR